MYRKEIVPGMCIRHFSTEDYGIIITDLGKRETFCIFKHYPNGKSKDVYSLKLKTCYNFEFDCVNQIEAINNLGVIFVSNIQYLLRVKVDAIVTNVSVGFNNTPRKLYNNDIFAFMYKYTLPFSKFYINTFDSKPKETLLEKEKYVLPIIRLELESMMYDNYPKYDVTTKVYIEKKINR